MSYLSFLAFKYIFFENVTSGILKSHQLFPHTAFLPPAIGVSYSKLCFTSHIMFKAFKVITLRFLPHATIIFSYPLNLKAAQVFAVA